uniref:Crb11 n=1 Tax=uncultured bacterium AOCarb11 TaxID=654972 RepID=D6MLY4_9BACT|nr:Crb11 [uncultured bacterium AOCarb11]
MKTLASLVMAAFAAVAPAHADDWSDPQKPFTIYGNTHYVGTAGISAVLITSPQGHVLIDGATAAGAKVIAANIAAMGYRLEDVKYILSSHSHEDHAGGISALQKLSGATVLAGAANVEALRSGVSPKEDPQFGNLSNFQGVAKVRAVKDGEVLKQGPLAITAHATPGHTVGGVSWTWQSCEMGKCKAMVFGDSLTAVSADSYRFSEHPEVVATFKASFSKVEALPCDVMITAHPGVNALFERQKREAAEGKAAYVDAGACKAVAGKGRELLASRLADEGKKK